MSKTTPARKTPQALDFKSATLYAIRVVLHEADTTALLEALEKRMNDAGAFFENEPVVVDASQLEQAVDWPALASALREHKLHPVGVIADGAQQEAAAAAGLPAVEVGGAPIRPVSAPVPEHDVPAAAVIPEKTPDSTPATAPAESAPVEQAPVAPAAAPAACAPARHAC